MLWDFDYHFYTTDHPHLVRILSFYQDDGFGNLISLYRLNPQVLVMSNFIHFISQEH